MNPKNQFEEMSLIDHLTELRKRLLWSFIYIIIILIITSATFFVLAGSGKPAFCDTEINLGLLHRQGLMNCLTIIYIHQSIV